MTWHFRRLLALMLALGGTTSVAGAQTIGTFSWQTEPYCNVVTVTVVQHGGHYQLVGSDNQCGQGVAPVTGTAVPAGAGVRFGVSITGASGRAAHLSASIDFASLSGTWTDDDGRTGAFVYNGAGGGAPRPGAAVVRAPRTTLVRYSQVTASVGGTISTPAAFRTLGTFTSHGGPLRLTWTSHIVTTPTAGAGACNFQLRVDGATSGPVASASLVGDEAVLVDGTGTRADAPVTVTTWFPDVPAGQHTIGLWLRSVTAACTDNSGNYTRTVLVEEYGAP